MQSYKKKLTLDHCSQTLISIKKSINMTRMASGDRVLPIYF